MMTANTTVETEQCRLTVKTPQLPLKVISLAPGVFPDRHVHHANVERRERGVRCLVPKKKKTRPSRSEEGWCEAERSILSEYCVRDAHGSEHFARSLPYHCWWMVLNLAPEASLRPARN